jgi:hypothetical protein
LTRGTSSSGTPKIRNSTRAGSAHAKSRTISACPSRSRSSQNLTVNSRTNGSISATRLGVKATLASFRTRVWAGGSTFARVGTDLNPPSSSTLTAIGHGGRKGEFELAAENSVGVRKNLPDETAAPPEHQAHLSVRSARSVAHEPSDLDILAERIDRRHPIMRRQRDELYTMVVEQGRTRQRDGALFGDARLLEIKNETKIHHDDPSQSPGGRVKGT